MSEIDYRKMKVGQIYWIVTGYADDMVRKVEITEEGNGWNFHKYNSGAIRHGTIFPSTQIFKEEKPARKLAVKILKKELKKQIKKIGEKI